MNKIYFCKISNHGSGLCNQFFSLITGIINAFKMGKKVIIIDDFSNDYLKNDPIFFSSLIDIDKFNEFLKINYDMILIEKNNVNFTVKKVLYGYNGQYIDITNKIIKFFIKGNTLNIGTDLHLNYFVGFDPCPSLQKNLKLIYNLNGINIEEDYDEYNCFLKNPIVFDILKSSFNYTFGWINQIDRHMFDNILKNLCPSDKFINVSETFLLDREIKTDDVINVIHLRVEDDAIEHWSRMNNMAPKIFTEIIINKYIRLIETYIDKNEHNIILSYNTNNPVIDYLSANNYKYYLIDKTEEGREINAWTDLNIGRVANNVFIGNFNLVNLNGSTFSYYLLNYYNKDIKKVIIDLDHIIENEKIY